MIVKKIIVDELPLFCALCKFSRSGHNFTTLDCTINNMIILYSGNNNDMENTKIPLWCPLEVEEKPLYWIADYKVHNDG